MEPRSTEGNDEHTDSGQLTAEPRPSLVLVITSQSKDDFAKEGTFSNIAKSLVNEIVDDR